MISEGTEPIGAGAELPDQLHGKRFLLYLGRREAVKNIDMLLRAFRAFRQTSNSPLDLVLAGPGTESLSEANVIDLELISDELKASLLRLATAVVQPSTNESFSRTMMEAWSVGRPVVVNANCLATAKAVSRSGGGWSAATEAEWVAAFHEIENTSSSELARLGELGRLYADEHADWDKIISRYEKLFDLNQTESQTKVRRTNLAAIHQLLPDMVYGDAISNQALAIRERLRANGYESEIFAKRCEDRMRASALLSDETQPEPEAALLYHHSIGSELTSLAVNHQGPKCLIYHNITPAQYFAPYRPGFAWMLDTGRKSLKRLAPYFEVSVGDSAYNARELAAHGFNNPGVLPIVIDPHRWNMIPDQNQMRCGQDGRTNILFTGRIAPNKKQDRLVEAFSHFQELLPESRLIIVGEGRLSDPFFHHLLGTIKRFNLESAVEVTGVVEEETLLAYYRTSHLYWSFSEHEGFGAPLVEAMWFDIPVCALEVTAVSETVGQAGVLFELDEDVSTVARRAYRLVTDEEFRQSIIDKQRLRRADFTPDSVWPILAGLVDRLATKPIISAVA
ncbi:MAG: hypothetical protein C5B55_11390 [Blastocatellia bacterium]|nr:MAG: hypothetical protein C5B55_11390 [Blastocatellia bacterium]